MKRAVVLILCVFVGTLAWRIGGRLSPDALGMGIGVVFGVLASVPAALLVLAAARRQETEDEFYEPPAGRPGQITTQHQPEGTPQIIVVAPPAIPMQQAGLPQIGGQQMYGQMALPGSMGYPVQQERQFHVVGDQDELIEDW